MPPHEPPSNSKFLHGEKPSARAERDRARIASLKARKAAGKIEKEAAAAAQLQREITTVAPEQFEKSPLSARTQLRDLQQNRVKSSNQVQRVNEMQPKVQDSANAKKPRQKAINPGKGFNPLAGTDPILDEFGRIVAPVRVRGADRLEEQEDGTVERTSGSVRYMSGWSGDHNKKRK